MASEEAAAARRKMSMLRSLVGGNSGDSPSSTARKSVRVAGLGRALGRGSGGSPSERGRGSGQRPGVSGLGIAARILGNLGSRSPKDRAEQQAPPARPPVQSLPTRPAEDSPESPPAKRIKIATRQRAPAIPPKPPTKAKVATRSVSAAPLKRRPPQGLQKIIGTKGGKTRRSSSESPPAKAPAAEKARVRATNALQVDKRAARATSPCSVRSKESGASRSRSRSSSSPNLARSVTVDREATVVDSPGEEQGASSGGFQQVVLDRLHSLGTENEDASVLAEYIVAMVAGNKSRHDIANELEPFFKDMATASEFVEWVEGVKVKFLTGSLLGSSPQKASPKKKDSPTKKASQSASSTAAPEPSAHVVVTKRAVLRPSPTFLADPPTAVPVSTALSPKALATSPRQAATYKAAVGSPVTSPLGSPVKQDRKHLLENMTRQLQTILTKLNDPNLNDETREKYQALAQSIQTQMAKVSGPAPPRPAASPRGPRIFARRRF